MRPASSEPPPKPSACPVPAPTRGPSAALAPPTCAPTSARCTIPGRSCSGSVADVAAFAAAAIWTYLLIPFALHRPGFELQALSRRQGLRRLRVRFPTAVATHSPEQVLHIDADGLIRRHDYTALAFGRWARAAHTLDAYRSFDGLLVATRRRVTPRVAGRIAPGPTLVWVEIDHVNWGAN